VARALAAVAADPPAVAAGGEGVADDEFEDDDAFYEEPRLVRFLDGDIRGYASHSLVLLADLLTDEAFDAVLDGLAGTSATDSFAITAAALRLAFPVGPAETLPPFGDLDDRQRRVVRALAVKDRSTWQWGNFTDIVQQWRLPSNQPDLRAYAGLAPSD
jgi:hypothetical protein